MQSGKMRIYIGIGLGIFALLFLINLFMPYPLGWMNTSKEILKAQNENLQRKTKPEGSGDRVVSREEQQTYELKSAGYRNKFYNQVDGYSLLIPKNMHVDMSMSQVRAVLENAEERIEIYHQSFEEQEGVTPEVYSQYSNQFLHNEIDHKTEFYETIELSGRKIIIAQWSREPLKHIENDKNYYASIDILLNDKECLTFIFKSNKPYGGMEEDRSYMNIIGSFSPEDMVEQPYFEAVTQKENSSWNQDTKETYNKYFGDDATLTWGIFEKGAPLDFSTLSRMEQRLQFQFPILLYYTGFMNDKDKHPNLKRALTNAEKEGRLLELTLQTLPQENQEGNMVYDVLNGKYDNFLKNYVKDIKEYGKPVLFRVGNEMNGDWCVYSAYHTSKDTEVYKAFYRYLYSLFQEAGATNVIWVWNPNGKSFPDFQWNHQLCYFPGNEYVDVVGMTMYNTGTYYEGETWLEFSELYDGLYEDYLQKFKLPLMITEFSSSSVGGDKEEWVETMFEHIKNYEELKVAIWWSNCDLDASGNVSRPYFLDETEELVDIFKTNLKEYRKTTED